MRVGGPRVLERERKSLAFGLAHGLAKKKGGHFSDREQREARRGVCSFGLFSILLGRLAILHEGEKRKSFDF